jgi:hypothetical protein
MDGGHLLSNYLPKYVEDIARHMASLPFPKFFRSKRSYDHGVLNLIDDEATKCLE